MVQYQKGALTTDALYYTESGFENLAKKIAKKRSSKLNKILKKYVQYHKLQTKQRSMSFSSAKRSLEIANRFCEQIKLKEIDLDNSEHVNKIINLWQSWVNGSAKRRTGSGKIKALARVKAHQTKMKETRQLTKFLRFIQFMKENELEKVPLGVDVFGQIGQAMKLSLRLVSVLRVSKVPREVENFDDNEQEEILSKRLKKLCDWLQKKRHAGLVELAAFISFAIDTGRRIDEINTMKLKDLKVTKVEKYPLFYKAGMQNSKTFLRPNICLASKVYVDEWITLHPDKDNPEALLFCGEKGGPWKYNNVSHMFKRGIENFNKEHPEEKIIFPQGHSIHYLRHLTAFRFKDWSPMLRRYYLGWGIPGIEGSYIEATFKDCIKPYFESLANNPFYEGKKISLIKSQEEDLIRKEYEIEQTNKIRRLMEEVLRKEGIIPQREKDE